MNKTDLINKIAESAKITKVTAGKVVQSLQTSISDALQEGENVVLLGFGTFSVKERAARIGRNPQTGKEIQIQAKKVVKFKVGKKLADSMK
jgi:DNA-binding protein HU-beta